MFSFFVYIIDKKNYFMLSLVRRCKVMKEQKFIPVLVGADIGTYSIARSFYLEYGVKSKIFSQEVLGATDHSKIIDQTTIPNMNAVDLVKELKAFAKETSFSKKILLACSEWYVDIIVLYKKELEKAGYLIPYVDKEILDHIVRKDNFYDVCEKLKINYPETIVVTKDNYKDVKIPWEYPIIAKNSDKNTWHYAEFPGKKKIFRIKNEEELHDVLDKVYHSSYTDTFCLQKMVPGDDDNMRVLTCYVNRNHEVVFSCLGQPVLEEKTPGAIGNYVAIITRPMEEEILNDAKKFLKEVKYVGYANFDIKYDSTDHKYKFFEINVRLGRSNFYMTASGANYAKYVYEEYVLNKKFDKEVIAYNPWIYTIVPNYVIKKYVKNKELVQEYLKLKKQKKYTHPLYFKKDINLKRWFYIKLAYFNQIRKFKKYF